MLLLLLLLAHPVVTIVDWAGNLERRPETELFIFHHFLASTFVPLSTREFTDVEQRIKLAPFSAARYTFEQVCNMNAVTRFIKKLSFFATPHSISVVMAGCHPVLAHRDSQFEIKYAAVSVRRHTGNCIFIFQLTF